MGSDLFRVAVLACLLAAGCAHTQQSSSVSDTQGGGDEFAEMDFWDGLAEVRAVTNADALHALLLHFGGSPGSHAERVDAARKKGWVSDKEALSPNETSEIGWIAKAVVMECGIKGGLTMRVLGPKQRYAVRELNHMGWLPRMSKAQAISGLQLIALLGQAEDYQTAAAERPSEDM